jgi:hypothetical protein
VTRIPLGELVVIENSRHGTPVDQPEAFNQAVAAFLQQCARQGPGAQAEASEEGYEGV